MTPPKPASPCEHERTHGFYSDRLGNFARKDDVVKCPFCKLKKCEHQTSYVAGGEEHCDECGVRLDKPAEGCEPEPKTFKPVKKICEGCGEYDYDCTCKAETQDAGKPCEHLITKLFTGQYRWGTKDGQRETTVRASCPFCHYMKMGSSDLNNCPSCAELKARVAELETSKAWNETTIATQNVTNSINNITIDRLTQSNDAMRQTLKQVAAGTYSSFDLDYKELCRGMMSIARNALIKTGE